MSATIHWEGVLTARSSIAHGGETKGTTTLLRRESIPTADGIDLVPVISGNAFRGKLRRTGEELLRDALQLEGELPVAAAHALRNGGALAKTAAEPLSGSRRAELRALVPQIGVFGCAAGGTLIDGCLEVGKVMPICAETAPLTGHDSTGSVFDLVQLEEYSKVAEVDDDTAMRYAVETFTAGTRFATWLRLNRATDLQVAFFTDLLAQFSQFGRLGGRLAIGHGLTGARWQSHTIAGDTPQLCDWRGFVIGHRAEILTQMQGLS